MAFTEKIIPQSVTLDIASSLVSGEVARFIKNLIFSLDDGSIAMEDKSSSTGVFKPVPSTAEYIENLTLPLGDNSVIGGLSVPLTKEVYVFVHNSQNNHIIYRLNGTDQTYNVVFQGAILNFQLEPQYFIHQGGAWLEILYISDPITGEQKRRSFLMFTDGFNPQGFICIEDSISTQSFNDGLFPYFSGVYNRNYLIRMGVPTPSDCIDVTESTLGQEGQNNNLLFNTWQFRLLYTDVWGRPSEHGIISNLYVPADGNCIGASTSSARCLNLSFLAPPPHINSIQVEYRNCNSQQWRRSTTLNLYSGSQFGDWWLRERNPEVNYNGQTKEITYEFCADKECDPIDPLETNRLGNALPRVSQALSKVGKFIALHNNKNGFLPFSEDLKSKLTVKVNPPTPDGDNTNYVNATVWVSIFNYAEGQNQPIYLSKEGIPNLSYAFGAFNTDVQYRSTFKYKQYFINQNQQGFVGYLAGTDIFVISKQFFLSKQGVLTEVTDFTSDQIKLNFFAKQGLPPFFGKYVPNGVFLQKFEFTNIPKGKYIFRIANHQIDPMINQEYQKTSTYVLGSYPFNSGNSDNPVSFYNKLNEVREIEINACNGGFDGFADDKILVIADLTFSHSDVEQGYVLNTNAVGRTQYPIELLEFRGGDGDKKSNSTDHNGFFFTADSFKRYENSIWGYCNCKIVQFFSFQTGDHDDAHPVVYRYLDESSGCTNYENETCNYVLIKGKVRLCNSATGIPGVGVVMTQGAVTFTDENGNYTLIVHDNVRAANRTGSVYFMSNTCNFTDCDGNCINQLPISFNPCINCNEREIIMPDVLVTYRTARGLLSGGNYPIGVTGWDWIDRPTFIQPLENIAIPSVQETQIFAPSTIELNIDPTAIFPEETEYITVSIGQETTIEEYVTWIVDSFQFVDNTGKENLIAPTQIKIFYGSLIEYNKQNDYNTTVNWGFISAATNTPVVADKVQFLLNGDGTFFAKSITALVKYNQDGLYFLINYTSDLKDLKANALIRLIRPKICENTEPYYEICLKIPIIDRHATIQTTILNAFDTYYLNREIPVPTLIPDTDPPEFIVEPRLFGFPFEHDSPSDFWGKGCKNIGRVNFKNPYEAVLYKEDETALSGALSDNGQLNYLNYFEDSKKINFDVNAGGIVAAFYETSAVLFICQNNWFTAGFNDNLLRTNSDGTVQSGGINNSFGKANLKIGNNYGCNLFDKNTIYYHEGLTHWLDTNRLCLVQNDYSSCLPISKNGADGYIRSKINAIKRYNLLNNNTRYFFGCTNPLAGEYLLSDKIIGDTFKVNDERDYNVHLPETNRFGIINKNFRGQYSFCPQYFSSLQADINDVQLFSFIDGKPHYHYSTTVNKGVGMVYGQSVNRIIRIVVALDNMRKKKGLAINVLCVESLYFVDQLLTETQKSRILKSQWKEADRGFYAPILCNENSGGNSLVKLMDGEMIEGSYIDIRFVGDPLKDNVESKLQGFLINVFGQSNNFQTG